MSEKKNNTQLWMVPYADLMSCMVILFLALYGFSYNMKGSEYEKALAQMQKELGMKHAAEKLKELEAAKKVEEDLKDQIKEGSLGVEVTTSRIKLTFASPVLFDSGSADLKNSARAVLDPVADSLLKMDNLVIVEGHTDSDRMLGRKFASNRELSIMRAFSVIDYLTKKGVPPERLTAFGYGEFRPAAPNDSEENKAHNRRIEMIIMRQAQAGETRS
ncbi:MAG: OmpA family protein [Elusimicrobia bacterium]|jgi:chemotaxis protein MotB|nr:OmpA family protein [Elusimicrobiota bacterium]